MGAAGRCSCRDEGAEPASQAEAEADPAAATAAADEPSGTRAVTQDDLMARKKRCVGRSWRLPGCSAVMLPGSTGAGGEGGRMLVGKVSHSEWQQWWRST